MAFGYKIYSVPRTDLVGGGIAIVMKDNIKHRTEKVSLDLSYESLHIELELVNHVVSLLALYSPEPNSFNTTDNEIFFNDFSNIVDYLAEENGQVFILGDFNFPLDNSSLPNVKRFKVCGFL